MVMSCVFFLVYNLRRVATNRDLAVVNRGRHVHNKWSLINDCFWNTLKHKINETFTSGNSANAINIITFNISYSFIFSRKSWRNLKEFRQQMNLKSWWNLMTWMQMVGSLNKLQFKTASLEILTWTCNLDAIWNYRVWKFTGSNS